MNKRSQTPNDKFKRFRNNKMQKRVKQKRDYSYHVYNKPPKSVNRAKNYKSLAEIEQE